MAWDVRAEPSLVRLVVLSLNSHHLLTLLLFANMVLGWLILTDTDSFDVLSPTSRLLYLPSDATSAEGGAKSSHASVLIAVDQK